jgi:hypothetical protein
MIAAAQQGRAETERQFRRRVCIAVPPAGFGRQLATMHAWLDAACGRAGWATEAAGNSGVRNDLIAFYFADADHADAFVDRFCCGYRAPARVL